MAIDTMGRIFYACQKVLIRGPNGTAGTAMAGGGGAQDTDWDKIQGLQNISINTNFNLQSIFQFGQLELYENYETLPEIEISLTKVFDGYPLIYHMAVGEGSLVEVANHRCGIRLGIQTDPDSLKTGGITEKSTLEIEPAYLSQVTYNMSTDDKFTEAVTLVSNSRKWITPSKPSIALDKDMDSGGDRRSPINGRIGSSVLVNRSLCVFPFMEFEAGTMNVTKGGGIMPGSNIKGVTITVNLPREPIKDMGFFFPKMRPIGFPADITCEIITTAVSGDLIGIDERTAGTNRDKNIHSTWTSEQDKSKNGNGQHGLHKSLDFHTIKIVMCDDTIFDLGSRNKLSSVAYNGDTSASNTLITYSFTTSNNFTFTANRGALGTTVSAGADVTPSAAEWFDTQQPLKFLD